MNWGAIDFRHKFILCGATHIFCGHFKKRLKKKSCEGGADVFLAVHHFSVAADDGICLLRLE